MSETEPTDKQLAIGCPTCNAKPGERCASLVDASKYRDIVHAERRDLAAKGPES